MFEGIKNLVGNTGKTAQYKLQTVKLRVKSAQVSSKELSTAIDNLKAALPEVQQTGDDLKKEVNKLNFKNKPHLDRIKEAQERIEAELATLDWMLTFKKKRQS